ncbi:uncharacterized protein LOC123885145 [Trifolium pratense]|uniref:Uncharacterized protein n=1 Tax=Trifolium pratense TaxID=57577 RepID=A0ACB0L5X9_TRIPR|nr:uncharacterized protein LOC123885145 [Trifolium pratense]CAJ2663856.1 unnamed protein product [Trifolium pratense]
MSCVAKYRTKLVKMDLTLEHKIHEIREEVTTLRAAMDRLTAMVKSLMAARNQSPTPPSPRSGATEGLRSILTLLENKFREGLGYSSTYASVVTQDTVVRPIQEFFRSACFINPPQPGVDAILEDDLKEDSPNFVTHEEDYVNMVYGCPGKYRIFDAHLMRGDLVQMHTTLFRMGNLERHNYGSCRICCRDSRGCSVVKRGLQYLLDSRFYPSHQK